MATKKVGAHQRNEQKKMEQGMRRKRKKERKILMGYIFKLATLLSIMRL